MSISKFEKFILISGTILAILSGFASSYLSSRDSAIMVTLITEVLTISFTVLSIVTGLRENLIKSVKESSELLQATEKLSIFEDRQFKEKYIELYRELIELSKGKYTINLRSDIYMDNIKSLDMLKPNEIFRATVPVSASDYKGQLSDEYFQYYIEKQIEMAQKGVKIIRLYLFPNKEISESVEIKNHLDRLVDNKIEIRILIRDEHLPISRKHVELFDSDFLVFGEKKVSIGQLGIKDNVVVSTQINIDPNLVKKYTDNFQILYDISKIYQKSPENR